MEATTKAKVTMNCPVCKVRCANFGKHRNGLRRFRCGQCGKTYTEAHKEPLCGMTLEMPKAVMVLKLLVEGSSVRSIERITGVHRDTIVERQNLTVRMQMRRLTRLTSAFSKKWENLRAAYCLHFAYYNFCRIHKSPRITPAMALLRGNSRTW